MAIFVKQSKNPVFTQMWADNFSKQPVLWWATILSLEH